MAVITNDWQTIGTGVFDVPGGLKTTFYVDVKKGNNYDINTRTSYVDIRFRSVVNRGGGSSSSYTFSCTGCPTITPATYGGAAWTLSDEIITYVNNYPVQHDPDGSKTLYITANASMPYAANLNVTINCSVVLETIPQESSLAAASGTIGSYVSLSVSRKSSAFTHSIYINLGGGIQGYLNNSGILQGTEVKLSSVTPSILIPTSVYDSFASTDKSKTGTMVLRTYNGNTLIGTRPAVNLVCNWNPNDCKPTLSVTLDDINTLTRSLTGSTSNNIILVDNKSIAKFDLTTNLKYNATISRITINGINQVINSTYQILPNNDDYKIEITDSRGLIASYLFSSINTAGANKIFTRIKHTSLTIQANTKRPNQTSDKVILKSLGGNYSDTQFNPQTANSLTLNWEVRESGSENYTTGVTPLNVEFDSENKTFRLLNEIELANPLSNDGKFNYQKSYDFRFTAVDLLSTERSNVLLTKGIAAFAFNEQAILFNGELLFYWEDE